MFQKTSKLKEPAQLKKQQHIFGQIKPKLNLSQSGWKKNASRKRGRLLNFVYVQTDCT